MPDKFSYYLDDDDSNKVKEMDHFSALQLPKDFKDNFDLTELKAKYKQLLLDFHPDRNFDNKVRATNSSKRINLAYELLSDEVNRTEYLNSLSSSPGDISPAAFNDRTGYVEKLDQLLQRLDLLAPGSQDDNIDKISMQFYEDYYIGMFYNPEVQEKQCIIFKKIEEQAKTGDAFYYLYQITSKWNSPRTDLLHKAVEKGSLLAIMSVAELALSGCYDRLYTSCKWGLMAIRYLEESAIPKLKQEEPTSPVLAKIQDLLKKVRDRRQEILSDGPIPADATVFNSLLENFIAYRVARGASRNCTFTLSMDLFYTVLNANVLQFRPVSSSFEVAALAPRSTMKFLDVLERLNEKLRDAEFKIFEIEYKTIPGGSYWLHCENKDNVEKLFQKFSINVSFEEKFKNQEPSLLSILPDKKPPFEHDYPITEEKIVNVVNDFVTNNNPIKNLLEQLKEILINQIMDDKR